MSGLIGRIKWGTVLALCTSIAAFVTSAYNNTLIQSDRAIRETPFVIPTIISEADMFALKLSNYSTVSARVKTLRLATGDQSILLRRDNVLEVLDGKSSEFRQYLGYHFFERFGIDISQPLGVESKYLIPAFLRVREDVTILEMSNLTALKSKLKDIGFEEYTSRIAADLKLEVCSCNIYENTCLIAGNISDIHPVEQCPTK